ncbi:hypothetical protein L6452_08689 [Arctium lappa]|uniref:Uncharacterized protein n=1 Tax=Arctium lappa TaxID=4217 RepID=A0ACB9DIF6_ARCLA|nr:hypothetical protein L6452_08689 [Arctium lappa]
MIWLNFSNLIDSSSKHLVIKCDTKFMKRYRYKTSVNGSADFLKQSVLCRDDTDVFFFYQSVNGSADFLIELGFLDRIGVGVLRKKT